MKRRKEFELGTTRNGEPITLNREERSWHMQVIGAPGRGKSKLLERMIRQDIVNGNGLCLIDPHAELYRNVLAFSSSLRRPPKIHLINPSEDDGWCFGFNPLRLDEVVEPTVRVDAVVNACAQVWGGEDTAKTPLLKKYLRAIFYMLAINRLTLLEAMDVVSAADRDGIRRFLTRKVEDPIYRTVLEDVNALPTREIAEQFSSTANRFMEFLAAPQIRRIVGQRENVIDFRKCMDEGDVVLVNLAPSEQLSLDNARLVGTLLVNEMYLTARGRTPEKSRPFYLYIDECYDYLNSDIEMMLDQTRKFGLHLILSHQRLGQLRKAGEEIYNGVLAGAQTKVVFGGMEAGDAKTFAGNIFLGELDLEKVKHVLDKPVVVDEVPEWLLSTSETIGESEGWSEGTGKTVTEFDGEETGSVSKTESESVTRGVSRSYTQGQHQSRKSVREERPGGLHTLEELMYTAVVKLVNQKPRFAIVKVPGRRSCRMRAFDVKDAQTTKRLTQDFAEKLLERSTFTSPRHVIEEELKNRRELLLLEAKEELHPPEPPKDGFRQKGRGRKGGTESKAEERVRLVEV